MEIQFALEQIPVLASQFNYKQSTEDQLITSLIPKVRSQGFLTYDDFLFICDWKSHRSRPHVERNSKEDVAAITKLCLQTENERLRIGGLTLLNGVDFPTASVILHFFHKDPYPILDIRALFSLGVKKKPSVYTFEFWQEYVHVTRDISKRSNYDMRTVDRALWQWSKNS